MTNDMRTPLCEGLLLKDRYQIRSVLGFGGFSITYLSSDLSNDSTVAIKEYFPSQFAVRNTDSDSFAIVPFSDSGHSFYDKGLSHVQKEADLLYLFTSLPSIVTLYDSFEENNTIYLVMEYIEGITLSQYIKDTGTMDFSSLLSLMNPVLKDLTAIHKRGLYHRDITPDNLILGIDNALHLIDFGAAKQENTNSKKNTIILRTGYAPPEQYLPDGRLGPWVDEYGICATMYYCLTGKSPADALARSEDENFIELNQVPDIKSYQADALRKGMKLRIADRFADIESLCDAFYQKKSGDHTVMNPSLKSEASASYHYQTPRRKTYFLFGGFAIVVVVFALLFVVSQNREGQADISSVSTSTDSPRSTENVSQSAVVTESTVSVKMTADDRILTMPKLTGKTIKKAKRQLKKLDSAIQIKIDYQYKNSKKDGIILEQSVPANTNFVAGQITTILLTVNQKTTDDKNIKSHAVATPSPSPTPKEKQKKDSYVIHTQEPYVSIPLD